jgi:hypothetical protein
MKTRDSLQAALDRARANARRSGVPYLVLRGTNWRWYAERVRSDEQVGFAMIWPDGTSATASVESPVHQLRGRQEVL